MCQKVLKNRHVCTYNITFLTVCLDMVNTFHNFFDRFCTISEQFIFANNHPFKSVKFRDQFSVLYWFYICMALEVWFGLNEEIQYATSIYESEDNFQIDLDTIAWRWGWTRSQIRTCSQITRFVIFGRNDNLLIRLVWCPWTCLS